MANSNSNMMVLFSVVLQEMEACVYPVKVMEEQNQGWAFL